MSGSFSGNYLDALAHPTIVDPTKAIEEGNRAAQAIWASRQQQANQAAGEVAQNALNPDGTVNQGAYGAGIAARGPVAALAAQQGLINTQSLQASQVEVAAKRNAAFNGVATAALDAPDDQLHAAAASGVQRLIDLGLMPREQGMTLLARLPNDPAALRQTIEKIRISTLPPGQQQEVLYGTPGSQTGPGGETIGTRGDPRTGRVAPAQPSGTGVAGGMSAADLDKPFQYQDENGQPQTTTWREWAKAKGIPLPQIIAPPASSANAPASLRNPNRPTSTTTTTQTTPPPAGTTPATTTPAGGASGPNPVVQEQRKQTAQQSATDFQGEAQKDISAQTQNAQLANMQSDLAQFVSGSGATRTLDFKRAIQSWAPDVARRFGIDEKNVAAQESFEKLANQIALSQQGASSDNRMNISVAANPHVGLSPEGADLIIRQLQGNADFIRARAKLANSYGDKTNYPAFQASIAKLDPRAFQLMRMTADQQKTYFNSLGKTTQDEIKQAWRDTRALIGG